MMSFIPRVFLPSDKLRSGTVLVGGADANHLKNVLRMKEGDAVTVCDGAGTVYPALIASLGEDGVSLALGAAVPAKGEFPFPVTVYQCLPKGEKADLIVQKSVELGAKEIVFVLSERCVARPDGKSMEKKRLRLQKIAESAAAQCGRGIVPAVRGLIAFRDAVLEMKASELPLFCHTGSGVRPLRELIPPSPRSVTVLIGPEGGVSDNEAALAKENGLLFAGLGDRILRTETAALFVLSAVNVLTEPYQ